MDELVLQEYYPVEWVPKGADDITGTYGARIDLSDDDVPEAVRHDDRQRKMDFVRHHLSARLAAVIIMKFEQMGTKLDWGRSPNFLKDITEPSTVYLGPQEFRLLLEKLTDWESVEYVVKSEPHVLYHGKEFDIKIQKVPPMAAAIYGEGFILTDSTKIHIKFDGDKVNIDTDGKYNKYKGNFTHFWMDILVDCNGDGVTILQCQ